MVAVSQEQIMQNWTVKNTEKPLVSVRCITYNHEPYIAQAIDGFLMQKTDFPFEVIIHDDASTDKTADIIREYERKYPLIIKPIYQTENQYSKRNGSIAKAIDPKLKGKYIAFCEGDDYWIDPNKLQMQVDFLERNPEYGMCYTKCFYYYQEKKYFDKNKRGGNYEDFEHIFQDYKVPLASVLIRNQLYLEYLDFKNIHGKYWIVGDLPMVLWFSINSRIKHIDRATTVYRILLQSASHFTSFIDAKAFKQKVFELYQFFFHYSGTKNSIILENVNNDINRHLCFFAIKQNDFQNAKIYCDLYSCKGYKDLIPKIICKNKYLFQFFSKKMIKR